jgi:hypothetical protein
MLDDSTRGTDILIGQLMIDQGLTNNKKSEQSIGHEGLGRWALTCVEILLALGQCERSACQCWFRLR